MFNRMTRLCIRAIQRRASSKIWDIQGHFHQILGAPIISKLAMFNTVRDRSPFVYLFAQLQINKIARRGIRIFILSTGRDQNDRQRYSLFKCWYLLVFYNQYSISKLYTSFRKAMRNNFSMKLRSGSSFQLFQIDITARSAPEHSFSELRVEDIVTFSRSRVGSAKQILRCNMTYIFKEVTSKRITTIPRMQLRHWSAVELSMDSIFQHACVIALTVLFDHIKCSNQYIQKYFYYHQCNSQTTVKYHQKNITKFLQLAKPQTSQLRLFKYLVY
ncbi:Hypothetical_protein [Hexamita inflata]|uniref:Hypothetical_protein n=1 Tax=Hexamita inflata TaxID=28002 RepID=A0AA86PGX2_9EUKA|nr:Hypothetical protein HINF_LOCUS26376 [Hexamita inflata]